MSTTTFSIRLDNTLLQRITDSATQQGLSRTEYILSWLPDTYDQPASNTTPSLNGQQQARR